MYFLTRSGTDHYTHVGIRGNARADKLARDAEDLPDSDFHIAESWTHFKKPLIREMLPEMDRQMAWR